MMADTHGKNDLNANSAQLLEWQLAAGADLAVVEAPIDRFATSAAAVAAATKTKTVPATQIPGSQIPTTQSSPVQTSGTAPSSQIDDTSAALEAQKRASEANTLEALELALNNFDGCALKLRATQLVFADGNSEADIMFIGESPGRDEDLQGKPFVGPAGQLLDKMLLAIGLDRTKVYIANTVPWRPPGNRTATQAEISACLPFLHRQIALVNPKILVTLGAPASQTMFGTSQSISRMRGQWRDVEAGGEQRRGMAMLHPAYLLRQPAEKKLAWLDLLMLKKALDAS